MRLAILGGGGFRVPLVYGALLRDHSPGRVTEVVLHDPDAGRLAAVALVLEQLGAEHADPPRVVTTDDLDTALTRRRLRLLGDPGRRSRRPHP